MDYNEFLLKQLSAKSEEIGYLKAQLEQAEKQIMGLLALHKDTLAGQVQIKNLTTKDSSEVINELVDDNNVATPMEVQTAETAPKSKRKYVRHEKVEKPVEDDSTTATVVTFDPEVAVFKSFEALKLNEVQKDAREVSAYLPN